MRCRRGIRANGSNAVCVLLCERYDRAEFRKRVRHAVAARGCGCGLRGGVRRFGGRNRIGGLYGKRRSYDRHTTWTRHRHRRVRGRRRDPVDVQQLQHVLHHQGARVRCGRRPAGQRGGHGARAQDRGQPVLAAQLAALRARALWHAARGGARSRRRHGARGPRDQWRHDLPQRPVGRPARARSVPHHPSVAPCGRARKRRVGNSGLGHGARRDRARLADPRHARYCGMVRLGAEEAGGGRSRACGVRRDDPGRVRREVGRHPHRHVAPRPGPEVQPVLLGRRRSHVPHRRPPHAAGVRLGQQLQPRRRMRHDRRHGQRAHAPHDEPQAHVRRHRPLRMPHHLGHRAHDGQQGAVVAGTAPVRRARARHEAVRGGPAPGPQRVEGRRVAARGARQGCRARVRHDGVDHRQRALRRGVPARAGQGRRSGHRRAHLE